MHKIPTSYHPTPENYFCISTEKDQLHFFNETSNKSEYPLVHVGQHQTPDVVNVIDMRGITFWQENYVIQKSKGVISSNEFYRYICKYLSVPFFKICKNDYPEKILEIISNKTTQIKTKHVGSRFSEKIIDVVPDHYVNQYILNKENIVYRFDILPDYQWTTKNIRDKRIYIRTEIPLDIDFLIKHKNVGVLYYFYSKPDCQFIIDMNKHNVKNIISCLSSDNLPQIKYQLLEITDTFFDISVPNKKTAIQKNIKISDYFKSNKLLVSENKIYPSKIHYEYKIENKNENELYLVFNDNSFWQEMEHYWIYSSII